MGLDYFLARYYSATQGRFTSTDEFRGGPDELYYFVDDASANPTFYADLRNPQSLNKYQYSFNNPLRYVDPDGHDAEEPEPPQDPKPVVPVPMPAPLPPVPIPIAPTTAGPTDQQILDGLKKIWELPDPYLYPISQTIGTAPDPTTAPVPIPITTPVPKVQPSEMARPIDDPDKRGHRKKHKKDHDKHTNPRPVTKSRRVTGGIENQNQSQNQSLNHRNPSRLLIRK